MDTITMRGTCSMKCSAGMSSLTLPLSTSCCTRFARKGISWSPAPF
uniref:Uncharacterized protein n=1 Tax=Arundo donax TaxID=35708 RepID=A0A0A9C5M8_ARUDO